MNFANRYSKMHSGRPSGHPLGAAHVCCGGSFNSGPCATQEDLAVFFYCGIICGDSKALDFDGGFLNELASGCGDTATSENIKAICTIDTLTESLVGAPPATLLVVARKIGMLQNLRCSLCLAFFHWSESPKFMCHGRGGCAKRNIIYSVVKRFTRNDTGVLERAMAAIRYIFLSFF